MKNNLNKFSEFANRVLPLEAEFLLHFQKFEDEEKRTILYKLVEKATSIHDHHFDESIDKRKYSYIKSWCERLLKSLDVDANLEKLLEWEKLIMTDSLTLADEKELLKTITTTESSDFNFIKKYDCSRSYRHYLQIRLRYRDYQVVNQFLVKFRTDYEFSKLVNDKLHEATDDIIKEYHLKQSGGTHDSIPWLSSLFYNENLDGYNRLLAWVRMVFIAHNKKQYSILTDMFQHFEKLVTTGKIYSRRIVTNFYSQYLLYYASMQNFEKAAFYGYLSIKEENNDYLYYINNLAAVLLRFHKPTEALDILQKSNAQAKNAVNFHNKIGHISYTIFALIDVGKTKQAENLGFVSINAYKKEIFEHRWNLFFNAYIKAMLLNHHFAEIVKVQQSFKLKDGKFDSTSILSPSIQWMCSLASYKMGEMKLQELQEKLDALRKYSQEHYTIPNIIELEEVSAKFLKK